MMLDKGQIKDWDGEPEDPSNPKPKAEAKSVDERVEGHKKEGLELLMAQHEALPTGERVTLTPEQVKARKRRGQWIALALFAFVILLFVLTMTKIGGNVSNWGTAFE